MDKSISGPVTKCLFDYDAFVDDFVPMLADAHADHCPETLDAVITAQPSILRVTFACSTCGLLVAETVDYDLYDAAARNNAADYYEDPWTAPRDWLLDCISSDTEWVVEWRFAPLE